jgi:ABC-type transport system substrate-binding protein
LLTASTTGAVNRGVITVAEVVPGGLYSFDPQLDYDVVGEEELFNVFQTLVYYNGSSSASFIPYLAAALPTVQNGGISHDYRTYTFQIRGDQYFSNGDKVTAYDVWYIFARGIAFANGLPGTPDWIQDQFLIPGVQNGSATVYGNNTWSAAATSITYDNSSNAVTFHLNRPVTPALFFQVIADPEGGGVIDHNYAESVGAGFDEATFSSYQSQANSGSYNVKMQWSPVGSGPYMIESLTPGQSVELVPNPKYPGVQGMPKANTTVVIDWVKTPDTALLMLQDGQADSVYGLPPSDFPVVQQLLSKGLVHIYNFPTVTIDFYGFNININKQLEANQFGSSQFNEPYNYFADLPTRLAWVNAYDYQGFLNNILGNAKYGTSFGSGYAGPPPPGVVYASPPSQLGGLPAQKLNDASGNFSISAWKDSHITIPIFVTSGDPTDLAAADEWATTLKQISGGNITAVPVPITTPLKAGYISPGQDPMGVYLYGWAPDYPYPSDTMDGMLKVGGYYPNGNNWLSSSSTFLPNTFAYNTTGGFVPNTPNDIVHLANVNGSTAPQDQVYAWINGNITMADSSTDPAVIQKGYKTAILLAIDMGLYVYTEEEESFWYWRSWLHGYQYQENPLIGAFGDLVYVWLSK